MSRTEKKAKADIRRLEIKRRILRAMSQTWEAKDNNLTVSQNFSTMLDAGDWEVTRLCRKTPQDSQMIKQVAREVGTDLDNYLQVLTPR